MSQWAAEHRERWYRGLPLAKRLIVGFALIAVLALAAIGAGAWSYANEVSARDHVINVVDRARLDADTLLADYVNEETGVRGYILSHERTFLQPYEQGVLAVPHDRRQLAELVSEDRESHALLAPIDAAASAWRQRYAVPAIAAVSRGKQTYRSAALLRQGKALFDHLRATFVTLDAALASSAASSNATLRATQTTFIAVAASLVALLIFAAALAGISLRSWVTRPIRELQRNVRQVTEGRLEHPVSTGGPPDLQELANDVETMRLRIVEELHALHRASDALADANDDLRRSNLELEQFAYVASHDLQEPLRKVVSFCELLNRRYGGQLDDRAREYIAFAVDGATRMQVLINDLLAFSRVGRNTGDFSEVSLEQACSNAVSNLQTAIAERGAEIDVGPLPVVMGDATLLTVLFQNLIGNGLKFNESTPKIIVRAERDGRFWSLSVADNGIGIEPRFAERIFVIFQRLHGRELYSGTGIGLALCKKIVEFHGGRIWLDTEYSSGSRMCWTLPAIGEQ